MNDEQRRFLDQLRGVYDALRSEMREKWHRDLPLEELLFDRWERARKLGFGEGTSIYHNSYVYGDVHVGERTWIGPFTILDGSGGLRIGSNCSISAGVHIFTHDSVQWARNLDPLSPRQVFVTKALDPDTGGERIVYKVLGHFYVVWGRTVFCVGYRHTLSMDIDSPDVELDPPDLS